MSRRAKTCGPSQGAGDRSSGLKPFIVRFDDWTAYRLTVLARDEQHAVELAQAMATAELWEAEVIDGGQEHFEAFPAPHD